MDMSKIDKDDSLNILIFSKNMVELRYKNLKKTGKDMSQKDFLDKVLLNIKNNKINFTDKTKVYMISFFEKSKKIKPFIVNKKSKEYLKASKHIQDDFDNIMKKNLKKDTKNFMEFGIKILNVLNKYKLNTLEKDSIIIDFCVSIGLEEVEVKLLTYKTIIDGLNKFIKMMEYLEKDEKSKISKKK